MNKDDIKKGDTLWLVVNKVRHAKVIIIEVDPITARFPDGHWEEVFEDELEPCK